MKTPSLEQMRQELADHPHWKTPEFQRWFSGSKVVDERGKPLRVYHGTNKDFSFFDPLMSGGQTGNATAHLGHFFSESPEEASRYAKDFGGPQGGSVMPVHLSLQNPKRLKYKDLNDISMAALDPTLSADAWKTKEGMAKISAARAKSVQMAKELREQLISEGYDGAVVKIGGKDEYIAFHPTQIKSAIGNSGTYDPNDPVITRAEGGGVSIPQMRLALLSQGGQPVKAPVSDLGFYSPTHEAALGIQRKQGNAQAFLNDLRKGGASKEELEHTGIHEFLKTKPTFTKDEVVAHIAKNAPQVKAVVYGGAGSSFKNMNRAEMAAAYERIVGYDPIEDDPHMTDEELRSQLQGYAREAAESDGITEDGRPAPKYNRPDLVLPGGQNYREVLLTLDKGKKEISDADIEKWYRDTYGAHIEDHAGPTWRQFRHEFIEDMQNPEREDRFVGAGQYRSSHWDEPNVLAHIRMNDRTDADGKKVLFVEELQSDWGQEGKKKGFVSPSDPKPVSRKEYDAHVDRLLDDYIAQRVAAGETRDEAGRRGINMPLPQLAQAVGRGEEHARMRAGRDLEMEGGTDKVPSAPFVTNTNDWVNLALKHVMKRAADEGYDRVAFVNGEQSANRYSLDKHLHSVDAKPNGHGGYELRVTPKEGRAETSVHVPEEELENHVGKDLAQKIAEGGGGYFEGNDLKMPHKGMRDFYDRIVPAQAQALLKKFGGGQMRPINLQKSGEDITKGWRALPTEYGNFEIVGPDGTLHDTADTEAEARQAIEHFSRGDPIGRGAFEDVSPEFHPDAPKQQFGFDITPAMRQALSKPMPYAEGGVVRMADGGPVGGRMPTLAEMKVALSRRANPIEMQSIGINEAPSINPKVYMAPEPARNMIPPAGGAYMRSGMPVGGVDMSRGMPGAQMLPQPLQPQGPQDTGAPGGLPQAPGGPQPPQMPMGGPQMPGMPMSGAQALQTPSSPVQAPQSNILQMTPQGRALSALGPSNQITQQMAKGGSAKSVVEMKTELAQKKAGVTMSPGVDMGTRLVFKAPGSGGVQGINVPKHMWEGSSGIIQKGERKGQPFKILGMKDINAMRAKVYGPENRDPLTIGQIGRIHKDTLDAHFAKPLKEQIKAEKEALDRLREAGHIGKTANTLDKSEKLDTVRHEYDEEGRGHEGFASKGVAGHSLYTSGHGPNRKFHVLNTCPGQTEGCGGGKDATGIVDTTKGTCFAPVAEAQYPGAAVRRACHEQAKHDPAMTRDWILAHTGSLRHAAQLTDKNNQRLLFRPNVVDETDTSSRHVIRHLNKQRATDNLPPIVANSYGKTNELHDPENGYYVTHSNVGPKVKGGREISENIGRDKQRISNTIMAANARGDDFKNEQGNKTPPKGSYMVTNVKRGSPMAQKMERHIKYAKYWSVGRDQEELTDKEKQEGEEGHFGANGKPTTPDKAHYGHTTLNGRRYDYQKQHILHPRLVNVPERKENKKTGEIETVDHMIPTDSRFKDTEFLPKNRFKTKNGKEAGHILMTTPTESTSNLGHETSFTHHVDENSINHAIANKGEYEIDRPEDQEKARGKEYAAPQAIQLPKTMKLAAGGSVYSRHPGLSDDDFHAFPERNFAAQRHLAMRLGDEEKAERPKKSRVPVILQKSGDAMRLELTRKGK